MSTRLGGRRHCEGLADLDKEDPLTDPVPPKRAKLSGEMERDKMCQESKQTKAGSNNAIDGSVSDVSGALKLTEAVGFGPHDPRVSLPASTELDGGSAVDQKSESGPDASADPINELDPLYRPSMIQPGVCDSFGYDEDGDPLIKAPTLLNGNDDVVNPGRCFIDSEEEDSVLNPEDDEARKGSAGKTVKSRKTIEQMFDSIIRTMADTRISISDSSTNDLQQNMSSMGDNNSHHVGEGDDDNDVDNNDGGGDDDDDDGGGGNDDVDDDDDDKHDGDEENDDGGDEDKKNNENSNEDIQTSQININGQRPCQVSHPAKHLALLRGNGSLPENPLPIPGGSSKEELDVACQAFSSWSNTQPCGSKLHYVILPEDSSVCSESHGNGYRGPLEYSEMSRNRSGRSMKRDSPHKRFSRTLSLSLDRARCSARGIFKHMRSRSLSPSETSLMMGRLFNGARNLLIKSKDALLSATCLIPPKQRLEESELSSMRRMNSVLRPPVRFSERPEIGAGLDQLVVPGGVDWDPSDTGDVSSITECSAKEESREKFDFEANVLDSPRLAVSTLVDLFETMDQCNKTQLPDSAEDICHKNRAQQLNKSIERYSEGKDSSYSESKCEKRPYNNGDSQDCSSSLSPEPSYLPPASVKESLQYHTEDEVNIYQSQPEIKQQEEKVQFRCSRFDDSCRVKEVCLPCQEKARQSDLTNTALCDLPLTSECHVGVPMLTPEREIREEEEQCSLKSTEKALEFDQSIDNLTNIFNSILEQQGTNVPLVPKHDQDHGSLIMPNDANQAIDDMVSRALHGQIISHQQSEELIGKLECPNTVPPPNSPRAGLCSEGNKVGTTISLFETRSALCQTSDSQADMAADERLASHSAEARLGWATSDDQKEVSSGERSDIEGVWKGKDIHSEESNAIFCTRTKSKESMSDSGSQEQECHSPKEKVKLCAMEEIPLPSDFDQAEEWPQEKSSETDIKGKVTKLSSIFNFADLDGESRIKIRRCSKSDQCLPTLEEIVRKRSSLKCSVKADYRQTDLQKDDNEHYNIKPERDGTSKREYNFGIFSKIPEEPETNEGVHFLPSPPTDSPSSSGHSLDIQFERCSTTIAATKQSCSQPERMVATLPLIKVEEYENLETNRSSPDDAEINSIKSEEASDNCLLNVSNYIDNTPEFLPTYPDPTAQCMDTFLGSSSSDEYNRLSCEDKVSVADIERGRRDIETTGCDATATSDSANVFQSSSPSCNMSPDISAIKYITDFENAARKLFNAKSEESIDRNQSVMQAYNSVGNTQPPQEEICLHPVAEVCSQNIPPTSGSDNCQKKCPWDGKQSKTSPKPIRWAIRPVNEEAMGTTVSTPSSSDEEYPSTDRCNSCLILKGRVKKHWREAWSGSEYCRYGELQRNDEKSSGSPILQENVLNSVEANKSDFTFLEQKNTSSSSPSQSVAFNFNVCTEKKCEDLRKANMLCDLPSETLGLCTTTKANNQETLSYVRGSADVSSSPPSAVKANYRKVTKRDYSTTLFNSSCAFDNSDSENLKKHRENHKPADEGSQTTEHPHTRQAVCKPPDNKCLSEKNIQQAFKNEASGDNKTFDPEVRCMPIKANSLENIRKTFLRDIESSACQVHGSNGKPNKEKSSNQCHHAQLQKCNTSAPVGLQRRGLSFIDKSRNLPSQKSNDVGYLGQRMEETCKKLFQTIDFVERARRQIVQCNAMIDKSMGTLQKSGEVSRKCRWQLENVDRLLNQKPTK